MADQPITATLPPIGLGPNFTGRFSAFVLDTFGAPKLSELNRCGAPELAEPSSQLSVFILNSLFCKPIALRKESIRAVMLFCRRTLHAVREYREGRKLLLGYVERLPLTNSHFLDALDATTHFEQCLSSACQAAELFLSIVELAAAPPVADDRLDRIKLMWNRSKHFDEDIAPSKVQKRGNKKGKSNPAKWSAPEITAPVWLTNEGVSSANANGNISFDELHAFLVDLVGFFESFAKLELK